MYFGGRYEQFNSISKLNVFTVFLINNSKEMSNTARGHTDAEYVPEELSFTILCT